MEVTPGNSTPIIAESFASRLTAFDIDADGSLPNRRVWAGLGQFCFACMLGGAGRTTLFLLTAEWRGAEKVDEAIAARTGKIPVTQAPAAGTGWP